MGWAEFAGAYAAFLLAHAVPARPPVRRRLVGALSERGYVAAYVVASLGLLAWLIVAAGRAPHLPLWDPAPWQRWVPNLLVPVAILLAALAVGVPNPFSFGGTRNERFAPERPGIVALSRHPILLSLALWAAAHVVPNGNLAHVLLFGGFAAMALLGMATLERRRRRSLGLAVWHGLARRTALRPPARGLAAAGAMPGFVPRVIIGLAAYGATLLLHAPVLGVSPLPVP